MMQCRDTDELMVEFLYQELEGERLAAFQKHVDGCARCGAEITSLVRTRQALQALPEAEPSPAISARLLHEAAKRAPKEERGGALAWLGKLFGPLAAHPAWAAVGSLLLVATVAGLLTVRGKFDGSMRPEPPAATAPAASPETTAVTPAAPAEPETALPGDRSATGADDSLHGKASAAKEGRKRADKAPDPSPGKVAASAAAPPAKKGKVLADSPEDAERTARTASTEEDLKLAEPARPPVVARPQPAKEEAGGYGGAELGGATAPSAQAVAPAPAPQAAPGGLAVQRFAAPAPDDGERGRSASGGAAAPATTRRDESKDAAAIQRESAGASGAQLVRKTDAAAPPKVAPEQQLLEKAQKLAAGGRCPEALGARDQIARMNADFFRRRVAGDSTLRSCEEQLKKNRAPARAVKPLSGDEAAAEPVAK